MQSLHKVSYDGPPPTPDLTRVWAEMLRKDLAVSRCVTHALATQEDTALRQKLSARTIEECLTADAALETVRTIAERLGVIKR